MGLYWFNRGQPCSFILRADYSKDRKEDRSSNEKVCISTISISQVGPAKGLTAAKIFMLDRAKALDSVMGEHWDSHKYAADLNSRELQQKEILQKELKRSKSKQVFTERL